MMALERSREMGLILQTVLLLLLLLLLLLTTRFQIECQ
jgi:hypothetical protein